ncbi:glycerophosphodiester phosphodiesterase family protein [Natranaerobius thermophilus]|uniref:Glycerophosphodiester phosphodiesterase n=1 Tax=Natranaerobius thermophilus (strain ATCC BAA-1301 / DSM 18059 / JW/NM-WN-LF) TaxID=457570 RepID=B2A1G0_NATTJ|nr:glycerophosphodiester phosphodiesterase family protein [Natranaerobius thermophilus]ACB84700.1 Glycerophosphodiester phosphodiesterase [Natranaerobius thermophilus JW/NM-WN-LF]
MLIIAHRGANNLAPENTLSSFNKALQLGADGIEMDVQLSRDGEPVIIHDEYLDRTTNGMGAVRDFNHTELQKLDAGSWFSTSYLNESIPTLKEVFRTFKSNELIINVELKNDNIQYPGLEEKVISLIDYFNLFERVIVSSFNHNSLFKVSRLDSRVKLGLLYDQSRPNTNKLENKVDFYTIHPHNSLDYKKPHKKQARVLPWPVNNREEAIKLAKSHEIFGIITDFPELFC